MRARKLGKDGPEASSIGFGAWAIGGWKWGGSDADTSIEAIRAALDSGVTLVDTAPVYGFGLSEELVGKAIEGRPRDEIRIATKCGLRWDMESPHLHAESEGRRIFRTLHRRSIRHEVEASLKRLGTDYIDLYQTHWPDPEQDMQDVAETLDWLKRDGLVRAVGFCNSDPGDLQAAAMHLDTDQERYSLLDREQEMMNLPVCEVHGLGFLAYSPIAQGLLTGRVDAKRRFAEGDMRAESPRFTPRVREAVRAVLAPIRVLADDRDVTVEQLVLAWTLAQPDVSHVLVGARTPEQARGNAAAGSLELDAEELKLVRKAAAAWPGFAALAELD